jgi:hypothetical protein
LLEVRDKQVPSSYLNSLLRLPAFGWQARSERKKEKIRGGGRKALRLCEKKKIPAILRDRQLDYLKANTHL